MGQIYRVSPLQALAGEAFSEIIDVRSPSEFAEDHFPGAVNLPVMNDAERAAVGTIYKQENPFKARRIGAPIVNRNIARHLEGYLVDKEKSYHPLVYCWRGGERSGAMATVLASIGWRTAVLDGGYKAYRNFVQTEIERLVTEAGAGALRFQIVAGLTGSGKTKLLRAMDARGLQVLDLEGLANHRGSLLGIEPNAPQQPSQKYFESQIFEKLRAFDPQELIYVESESNKVGNLHIPAPLWKKIRASAVIELVVPRDERARFLTQEYAHFGKDSELLFTTLEPLRSLVGEARIARWKTLIDAGEIKAFVADILEHHYDPAYLRSRKKIFHPVAEHIDVPSLAGDGAIAIGKILASARARNEGSEGN